jgi:hypothetical protein
VSSAPRCTSNAAPPVRNARLHARRVFFRDERCTPG